MVLCFMNLMSMEEMNRENGNVSKKKWICSTLFKSLLVSLGPMGSIVLVTEKVMQSLS